MVTAQGLWPAISRLLGLPANEATEQRLMQTYKQVLQSFEDYVRLAQGLPSQSFFMPRTHPQMTSMTPLQTTHSSQPHYQQPVQPPRYVQPPAPASSQPPEKRKRTSLPAPAVPAMQPQKVLQTELETAITLLGSSDWNEMTKAVNTLTRLTLDHDKDMLFESFPTLLGALTTAMDHALPVARMAFDHQVRPGACINKNADFEGSQTRPPPSTQLSSHVRASISHGNLTWQAEIGTVPVVHHLFRQLPANKFELALLNVLRNMSIDPANEMHIAHSATAMRHLCVCLVDPTTDAASHAFDILAQVCRYIDVTGRKRAENDLWLEDTFTHDKSALKLNLNADLAASTTAEYLAAVWGVLACTMRALFREEKEVVLRALDLLIRLAYVPENRSAFLKCPQEMLERVVELLCVTYSSFDPLAVHESEGAAGLQKTHGTYLPPAAAGDFEERLDTDVRDLAIEFFVQLCNLSPDLQASLIAIPETLPILRQLVQTKVGRPEVPRTIGTLLNQLTLKDALHSALALTQLDFVKATCEGSDLAADLACGSLREIFAVPSWTEATTAMKSNVPMSLYTDPTTSLPGTSA